MSMPRTPPDPVRLLPLSESVFQILLALADEARHGYGILQEVEARTGGRVRLGPGTLYGAIKRLCEQGVLEEVAEGREGDGEERRRYYALTAFGREVARAEATRLERLLEAARGKRLLPQEGAA
jgi:DNA-binding PadR family transcriptional regulator